ncbi:MAG: enoyl-CoA hydratase-related protein [Polyangia bacterium]
MSTEPSAALGGERPSEAPPNSQSDAPPDRTTDRTTDLVITDHGAVREIALNRPQTKNGLTDELFIGLRVAFEDAAKDDKVRAVLLTGRGGSFCSGLDLKAAMAMVQASAGNFSDSLEDRLREVLHRLIRSMVGNPKPIIALVDGAAAGFGCDLALCCDLRIGTARARFGEIFIKRGLMPDGGGTYTLPRLVGVGRAFDMLLTGDVVESDEALRIGLLSRIVKDADEGLALAQRIAAGPPLVLREIKRAVWAGLEAPLDAALEREAKGQLQLLRSQDFIEGITAFLMKRPPVFSGQ